MCGLFGWQWANGKKPKQEQLRKLSDVLSKAMDGRGGQAWGVWSKRMIYRGLGPANPHSDKYADLDSMFGHSRYKTHGDNKLVNTHPFVNRGVSLSHNGVLSNHTELNSKFSRKFEVDSMHILAQLVEKKPMVDILGYGAITWARDHDEECIYMGLLSRSGSLHVVETEFGIVWASTKSAVDDACKAAKIKIETQFDLAAGEVYFAEKGKLFKDTGHASILVGEPPVVQHWSSYPAHNYGPNTTYWCNEHLKAYLKCPHKAFDQHIVKVLSSALPKEGEKGVEYKPPMPTPPAMLSSGAYSRSNGGVQQPFCSRALCMNRQTPKGILCATHQEESDSAFTGQTTKISGSKTQTTSGRGVPPFCQATHCFEPRRSWDDMFCVWHEANQGSLESLVPLPERTVKTNQTEANPLPSALLVMPDVVPLTEVVPGKGADKANWVNDFRAAWTEDAEPTEATKYTMKCDLASWWLEDHCGAAGQLGGMTPTDILQLAEEMGFDAEAAVKEVLNPTEEKEPNANPDDAESPAPQAGVQQSAGQHEPANGGGAEAVGGSASVGSGDPTPLSVLRGGGDSDGGGAGVQAVQGACSTQH